MRRELHEPMLLRDDEAPIRICPRSRALSAALNACADVHGNAQKLMMASHSIALMMLRLSNRSTRRPDSRFPAVAATPHSKNIAGENAFVAVRDTLQHHARIRVHHEEPAEGE